MSGPLPEQDRRRRNAPTIPTTNLPAGGRKGRVPAPPAWRPLGRAGRSWWDWAWRTPQAAAWGGGHEGAIARRASLEDDLAAIENIHGLDFDELSELTGKEMRETIARVAALATGRLAIMKEMRELEDRLGLTPRAMAALRWKVVEEPTTAKAAASPSRTRQKVTRLDERRTRLTGAS